MNMHFILIGAPGSGKGSLAKLLVDNHSYAHISTGDLLRAEMKKGSDLGMRISDIMKSGALVNDRLVFDLLSKNCDLQSNAYIFDGFPRTLEQAKMLRSEILDTANYRVLFLSIDPQVVISRLCNRRGCPQCGAIFNIVTLPSKVPGICDVCSTELLQRDDDKEDVIMNRLTVFNKTVSPILDYFTGEGKLTTIDASQETSLLYKQVVALL